MSTIIKLVPAGPAVILNSPLEHDCEITKEDGTKEVIKTSEHIALCRCTKSQQFPFCDGSHKR